MTTNEPNPWAAIIGACYRAASIERALGWSTEQVTAEMASLRLLELETDDDVLLYPAFQVWQGRLVQGLEDVLPVLSTGTASPWTWAPWLNAPFDDETGEPSPSAIEQLRAGRLDDVLRDPRHAAWSWGN